MTDGLGKTHRKYCYNYIILFGLIGVNSMGRLAERSEDTNLDSLDTEIKELEKTLQNYERRRSNLLEAMELGEFDKGEILDRLNTIKQLRCEDEVKLNDLVKTREHITSLSNAKVKLSELYNRVIGNLQHSNTETKRLAFDALDIKVYASRDKIEIRGVIPVELALPTTAQTSGCLLSLRYNYSIPEKAWVDKYIIPKRIPVKNL